MELFNMLNNECIWKNFKISDIFFISKGKRLTKSDMIEGTTNYIGAISDNNGIREFINAKPTHNGNCITVNYNGSVGEAFYQKDPFWASDDVNVLTLKDTILTKEIGFFLCTLIKVNKYRFNYGRKWNLEKMKETTLLLPVRNNKIDWNYIEEYISQIIEKTKLTETIKTNNKITENNLDISKWKEFKLDKIFNCYLAKPYHKDDILLTENLTKNKISYITRSSFNNGVSGYINQCDLKNIETGNALTVGAEGVVFFYQENSFICGNKINVLRNDKLNKYNALFFITVSNLDLKNRFNYGRAIVLSKLKNEVVKLPVNLYGEPDWQFMEDYIKQLPYADKI